jgi:PST family polysaccharide transporter
MFIAVIFRSLSKLCDSLLRAKGAVYQGSWFKAIYVILIALGIVLMMPYGMPAVAGAVVFATIIHYLMSMYMCTKLIGVQWNNLFSALFPSFQLGFMAAMMCLLFVMLNEKIGLSHLLTLLCAAAYVFGVVLLVIYNRPQLLGDKEINPLYFLPERIKKHRWLASMMNKLEQF